MAKLLKLRRGTTTQHASFTGAEGELTIDTTKDTAVVHDAQNAGGKPLAREDMSNVSSASIAGQLGNDAIDGSKISDASINNAEINGSAAIAGTKISPDFGSQNLTSTGYFSFGTAGGTDNQSNSNLRIQNTYPTLFLNDTNTNNDFYIRNADGTFGIHDVQNAADRLTINSSGTVATGGNLDVGAGCDVTGDITATGNITANGDATFNGGDVTIEGTQPGLHLTDTNNNDDFLIYNNNGTLKIYDSTDGADRFSVNSSGTVGVNGNLDVGSGVDVTGNITCTGTVDGVDVALLNTNAGSFFANGSGQLVNGVTATTQSQGDGSTKIATTAYTDTAVSNLVDSSPGALNTLNELAAAINDDASFSTTVNNNIATKLPLAGGTVTGTLNLSSTSEDCLNFNGAAGSDRRGVAFNGRIALSSDQNDGYLRLNDASEFGNGVYTPSVMRSDGGFHVGGTTVINSSAQVVAARITGALPAIDGSALTGIVSFVQGMIILWSGAQNAIPSGWVLCNGSNSTPDLRDRFVVGAGNSYSVGATGGSNTATDSVSISVSISGSGTTGNPNQSGLGFGSQYTSHARAQHTHNFSFSGSGSGSDTVSIDTRSPYYALCYIMKS